MNWNDIWIIVLVNLLIIYAEVFEGKIGYIYRLICMYAVLFFVYLHMSQWTLTDSACFVHVVEGWGWVAPYLATFLEKIKSVACKQQFYCSQLKEYWPILPSLAFSGLFKARSLNCGDSNSNQIFLNVHQLTCLIRNKRIVTSKFREIFKSISFQFWFTLM